MTMESGWLVYKYEVPTDGTGMVEIPMPFAFDVLSAGLRGDTVVIWVEHFHEAGQEVAMGRLQIYRAFTGHIISTGAFSVGRKRFIGTVQQPSGLVWHLYRGEWVSQ